MKTIPEIIKIVETHNDVFNHHYVDVTFEVDRSPDDGGRVDLYIHTKFLKLPDRRYCTKIRRLLDADEVSFVDAIGMAGGPDAKNFWAVTFFDAPRRQE